MSQPLCWSSSIILHCSASQSRSTAGVDHQLASQKDVVQNEKAQLRLECDAVAAKLAVRDKELATARVSLRDCTTTIDALESNADHLDNLLCFYKQQLLMVTKDAKVCMPVSTPVRSSLKDITGFGAEFTPYTCCVKVSDLMSRNLETVSLLAACTAHLFLTIWFVCCRHAGNA